MTFPTSVLYFVIFIGLGLSLRTAPAGGEDNPPRSAAARNGRRFDPEASSAPGADLSRLHRAIVDVRREMGPSPLAGTILDPAIDTAGHGAVPRRSPTVDPEFVRELKRVAANQIIEAETLPAADGSYASSSESSATAADDPLIDSLFQASRQLDERAAALESKGMWSRGREFRKLAQRIRRRIQTIEQSPSHAGLIRDRGILETPEASTR